jgi:O-antigen/teichoic acid export membrane protein
VNGTESSASYVRGSSLLLAGRLLSLMINFAGQVIIVRYLSKTSYGSYAFALSLATMISNAASLGFQTTIARFAPIYREERDFPRMFGSLLFMAGVILAVSLGIIVALLGVRGLLSQNTLQNPATMGVLLIFIYFIPINALDRYLEATMAVFAGPKAIFVRRHLVGPGLKLLAVGVVVATAGDERLLAWGYVGAGGLGVLLYVSLLVRVLRKSGLLAKLEVRELRVSASSLFGYGMPVMLSDLNFVARGALVLFLLESLHGSESVAEYRAIVPLADLNKLVSRNFAILFIPVVATLLARGETKRIADVVRQSMTWIAVLTLPLFLCCFVLSESVAVFLFGDAYAVSAPILAVLSLAHYVHAISSVSALSLKAFGMLRWMLVIELGATLVTAALAIGWIPAWGAVGAGWAVGVGSLGQGLLTFAAMQWLTGLRTLTRRSIGLGLSVVAATLTLWGIQQVWALPLWASVPAAGVLSTAVLVVNRDLLTIANTFPELGRIPLVGRLAR